MFEGRMIRGFIIKRILEAIKDLVSEASWDCSTTGMSLQAMDTSHVSLVSVQLKSEGFDKYRCDRNLTLGMNLASLAQIVKAAGNDDVITIKAPDDADKITLIFETKNEAEKWEYEIKLMNLDSEYLGIPETDYSVKALLPSHKFQRICRDLSQIGDSVTISAAKDGIRFSTTGDLGSGTVKLNQTASADKPEETVSVKVEEPIILSFALKYLNHFARATALSPQVSLSLSKDVPLVVEYMIHDDDDDEIGYIRYYLAPKIEEGEE
ncbi:proliferating cell nuclear antigen-like [Panonychus citri]|uniref:proliferating cell nuclear antigen-like n=1 Tax=Panonychus citri TaxID=50023 RepID=UPI002307B8BE|nr:proliferating cell nuclear antigen-like [Panonychus citri]